MGRVRVKVWVSVRVRVKVRDLCPDVASLDAYVLSYSSIFASVPALLPIGELPPVLAVWAMGSSPCTQGT
jgi:hypothetical protein